MWSYVVGVGQSHLCPFSPFFALFRPNQCTSLLYYNLAVAKTSIQVHRVQERGVAVPKHYPSKISKPISIRLKNEQIDAIDLIVKLGEFPNRQEAMHAMLMPSLKQFCKVIETKSILKGAKARIQAELQLAKHLSAVEKNTEVQDKLELEIPGLQTEMI